MSGRSADGSGQTQPTQRIDVAMAQFEEDPPTQALPVHEIRASAAQAVPPSYVAGGVPVCHSRTSAKNGRLWWR